jgi:glutamyl-Q tRNA(Asp) synthetase
MQRALRLRVDLNHVSFSDMIIGLVTQDLSASCGDFIVKRADGPVAYHLATVVDDHDAGVNQVVRGADLLTSTPRQILLQHLLDYSTPAYGHLPLVTGPNGEKLSKRDNAVSLASGRDLAKEGIFLLLAALSFLGQPLPSPSSAAISCRELLALAITSFDPALIPTQPGPVFLKSI